MRARVIDRFPLPRVLFQPPSTARAARGQRARKLRALAARVTAFDLHRMSGALRERWRTALILRLPAAVRVANPALPASARY